jgi:putative transcriptional regulator
MLFVTYPIIGTVVVRIISARGAEPHEKRRSITRFRLNPKNPPKTDWRSFDAMSAEERHLAALSDADCLPATKGQLVRARRVPTVRALRKKLKLTQEEFAARFHSSTRHWSKPRIGPTRQRKCF